MFYCTNSYGSVFNVEVLEKRVKARLSTSEKNQDGTYTNSNWNAVFIGGAYNAAKTLTDRDRIHITKCKVSNEPYTNKDGEKRSWLQVTIFEFEKLGSNNSDNSNVSPEKPKKSNKSTGKAKAKSTDIVDEISDDDLPF